jgi:maleylpyruvate isomerase
MSPVSHPTATHDLLRAASQRLVRTVDALPGDAWRQPSLLPGWSIAHVAAHLALNAEALTDVLVAVKQGRSVTMYPSQEARDADIERLAASSPADIRDRVLGSVTGFDEALAALPELVADTEVERTPGSGRHFTVGAAGSMRLREVEIHHADITAGLGGGYSPADWSEEFACALLDDRSRRWQGRAGFRAEATDLDRVWRFGEPGPTVSGPAHQLAWWSTGRAAYPGTTGPVCVGGELPRPEAM